MRSVRLIPLGGLVVALLLPAATAQAASTTTVNPGHSIQAAIDAAPAGGTVSVNRGTYRENLTITKSIRLVGHGAVLRAPTSPTPNTCSQFAHGATTGICVTGTISPEGLVTSPIANVRIQGLTIAGFAAMGIFAIGVTNFSAIRNTFANNGDYGIFANQSSGISFLYNVARNNGAPGLYIGDSPNAAATVVGNQSYGNNGEGLLFRDASGGRITGNSLHGNCAGLFVIDTGAPGPAGNVSITLNDIWGNNRLCPGEEGEAPPLGGIGIGLLGSHAAIVALNLIRNNVAADGSQLPGGGIIVLDTTSVGGGVPTDNSVHHNWLSGNQASDLMSDGTGSGNTFIANSCTTSLPPGSC